MSLEEVTPMPAQPLVKGEQCPAVSFDSHRGPRVTLGMSGQPMVLVFVPAAYTPLCGSELDELLQLCERAEDAGVQLAIASCDSVATLASWLREHDADERILGLSDFWPHGEAARRFGVFDEHSGQAKRYSFAISSDGVIVDVAWAFPGDARPLAHHARLLRRLSKTAAAEIEAKSS